jgi:hypothetical protein
MAEVKRINWSDKASWPYGGAAHTFIAEAVKIVGRHVYADEWKGDEFWSGYLDMEFRLGEGALADAERYHRLCALSLLRHFRTDIAPERTELLTDEMWTAAQALLPQYANARREAAIRRRKAKEKLRDLCAKGDLVSAFRLESGDHYPIKAARWNTEKYLSWLQNGWAHYSDIGSPSWGGGSDQILPVYRERWLRGAKGHRSGVNPIGARLFVALPAPDDCRLT